MSQHFLLLKLQAYGESPLSSTSSPFSSLLKLFFLCWASLHSNRYCFSPQAHRDPHLPLPPACWDLDLMAKYLVAYLIHPVETFFWSCQALVLIFSDVCKGRLLVSCRFFILTTWVFPWPNICRNSCWGKAKASQNFSYTVEFASLFFLS